MLKMSPRVVVVYHDFLNFFTDRLLIVRQHMLLFTNVLSVIVFLFIYTEFHTKNDV